MIAVAERKPLKLTGKRSRAVRDETPLNLELLSQNSERAYCVALRVTRSAAMAEDAVQEAYASLLRHPPRCSGEEHMRNCFFAAVHRQALMLVRGEGRRRRHEKARMEKERQPVESVVESQQSDEMALAARSALDSLPVDERTAVSLCCEQGLSLQSAADILGVPKQTLVGRVNRGLEKLRKSLTAQGFTALTPAAISAALTSLPLPAMPEGLPAALRNIAADPFRTTAKSLSATAAIASGAKILWIFTITFAAAGIAGGLWWRQGFVQKNNAESSLTNMEKTKDLESMELTKENNNEDYFYRCWTFEKPADDFTVVMGKWNWRAGDERLSGVMIPVPQEQTVVLLPINVPARPFVVTADVVVQHSSEQNYRYRFGVYWWEEADAAAHRSWLTRDTNIPPLKHGSRGILRSYFLGRHTVAFYDEKIVRLREYEKDYPGERLAVSVRNWAISKIEIRELTAEEEKKFSLERIAELKKELNLVE